MVEAESFLMKSTVRSIWPHSRAAWCVGLVECVDRAEGRSVWRCRPITFSWCVAGGRIARAIALKPFALGSRAHSGARSVVPARRQSVFLRNRLSALCMRPGWSQDRAVAVAPDARGWRAGELRGMGQVSLGCGLPSVSDAFVVHRHLRPI